jgi:hypothetical protein
MSTITMPFNEAVEAMGALLPHAAKDDIMGTLVSVRLEPSARVAMLLATDRYSVGQWTTEATVEGEGFIIPRNAAEWIAKLKPADLRMSGGRNGRGGQDYFVTIRQDDVDTQVEIRYGDAGAPKVEKSQTFDRVTGNYPPVGRILATAEAAEPFTGAFALSALSLTKVLANAKLIGGDARFAATVSDNPAKPGPVRVTFAGEHRFQTIVQPNLIGA